MPLGLKPCCAVCKTNSSSMWKKGNQGEILCNNCTGKSSSGGATGPSMSSNTLPSNGGGKQSKQEIHRRSARLRSTKYKAPASEKKVSTKGKGRRHIFKLKNPIKAPESVATIITSESVFYKVQWFLLNIKKDHSPEEDLPRKMEYLDFVCHAPSEYFKSRSSPFPTIPNRPEKGYVWTHIGPSAALTAKESNLYVELRANKSDHKCKLKDVRPPKKTADRGNGIHLQVNKQTQKKSSHAGVTECNMVSDEDTQQEWVFTLYNFDNSGKVTKEEKTASQEAGNPVRGLYCVDENIERRNHYLDLAGIENYTSKFDGTESATQEPSQDTCSAPKHRPVVSTVNCMSPGGQYTPYSLKSKAMGKDRHGGDRKSCRLHGQHPASWCHPSQPAAHSALQRSHSRRLRTRGHEAASRPPPEIPSDSHPSCGAPASQTKRHEHHHEHHHHHHHHYHPS
nr:PREDICTED: protein naked cuticle homolog 2-like [Notothenia coriiceps]